MSDSMGSTPPAVTGCNRKGLLQRSVEQPNNSGQRCTEQAQHRVHSTRSYIVCTPLQERDELHRAQPEKHGGRDPDRRASS